MEGEAPVRILGIGRESLNGQYKSYGGMTLYTVVFGTRFSIAPAPERAEAPIRSLRSS